jgi:hypothetical protein
MSLRLSALALLAAAATLAGPAANAGGLSPNLNIRTIAIDSAIMTGRHPIIGYGPSYIPQPTFGGVDHRRCRTTKFDPNSQFEGCTDNVSAGNTTLKPPK